MRTHVDDIRPDGTNVASALLAEIRSLEDIPLDDTVAESPHARANHVSQRARRGTFAWQASTMRLKQNLVDVADLGGATGADLEAQWDCYKSIVQMPGRGQHRPKRMTRKKIELAVYHLSMVSGGGVDLSGAPAPDDQAVLDDGGIIGDAVECAPAAPLAARPGIELTEAEQMLREYLIVCLKPYAFYSFPVQDGDQSFFSSVAMAWIHHVELLKFDACCEWYILFVCGCGLCDDLNLKDDQNP